MADVIRASLELPTVVFTALLAFTVLLWVLSMFGALDVGLDSADGAIDDSLSWSDVPASLLLSIFSVVGWAVSALASIYLLVGRSGTELIAWSIAVGALAAILAMLAVVWLSPRLARLFATDSAPSKRDLLGRIAEVRSETVTDTHGRGEARWPDGTVSTVDLRTTSGSGVASGELRRGDLALLVDWVEQSDDFIVGRVPAELAD